MGLANIAAWLCVVILAGLHGWGIWTGLGGRQGLTNGWPIWRDDHPLYYHSAMVTRHFLKATGTTAGYDPSFMSGYAKSVIYPASSTLPELVLALFGGAGTVLVYKLYVLVSAAIIPWLLAWAGVCWKVRAEGIAIAVLLFLLYVWTDFPIGYAGVGMLPYLLAIPLGLTATGAFCRFLREGALIRWCVSTTLMVSVVLVHLTAAMIVVPAAGLGYAASVGGGRSRSVFPRSRHVGVWLIPVFVIAANAFWWLPGIWLASTKGPSDFAFAHPEGILRRFRQVETIEPPIQSLLIAAGTVGLAIQVGRDRILAAGLAGFAAAGFFWGYLAGGLRSLDFLQPGRHTFAFYSALALASGIGVSEMLVKLGEVQGVRVARWVAVGLLIFGIRIFGPILQGSYRIRLQGKHPFLSSRPSPRLSWVVSRVKRHVKPGERLLYEEGGFGIPGVPDPFQGGRFSGLLVDWTGVELIGGPYLHASLLANFTQFGEGKLFGKEKWTRDHFVRYARLYRPAAILCWSPWARAFCESNPDLIEVLEDEGVLMIGRVLGFPGDAIEGEAVVEARPGRLVVRAAKAGVDGTVVLRYHSVPCLRTSAPVWWEPVFLEEDPTPFIRLRPPSAPVAFEIEFFQGSGAGQGHEK